MLLIGKVTGIEEVHRQVKLADGSTGVVDDIGIQFKLSSADPDLNASGSQLVLVLPRVLGKRWEIGQHTRINLEDITNGQEQTLTVV